MFWYISLCSNHQGKTRYFGSRKWAHGIHVVCIQYYVPTNGGPFNTEVTVLENTLF